MLIQQFSFYFNFYEGNPEIWGQADSLSKEVIIASVPQKQNHTISVEHSPHLHL